MKLIKTQDYLLGVDESEIKEGDLCYDLDGNPGYKNNKFIVQCLRTAIDSYWNKHSKKIIAHLPLNNLPILHGVPLLPPLEDDVEKLADEHCKEQDRLGENHSHYCYITGYTKAREKYKFTEEDILDAWEMGGREGLPLTRKKKEDLFKILSIPTKMPVEFEIEMGTKYSEDGSYVKEPILVTNNQGNTVMLGTYKY